MVSLQKGSTFLVFHLHCDSLKIEGPMGKCQKKMRNNDFHQLQPGHFEKTSVLGNWANFEVDRTKIEMYMPIQIISHQKPSLGATYSGTVFKYYSIFNTFDELLELIIGSPLAFVQNRRGNPRRDNRKKRRWRRRRIILYLFTLTHIYNFIF